MHASAVVSRSPVTRVCRCGCGKLFNPNFKRPGQEYLYGHRPHSLSLAPKAAAAEPDRRLLDYRLAAATARTEAAQLVREIDRLDDQLEEARKRVHDLEAAKDLAVDRHLGVVTTIECLDCMISGKSVAQKAAE